VTVFALVSASVGGWPYLKRWVAHRVEVRKQSLQPASMTALQASLPQPVQAASNAQAPSSLSANPAQAVGVGADSRNSAPPLAAWRSAAAVGGAGRGQQAGHDCGCRGGGGKEKKAAAKNISLVLTAKQRCWVSIQVDGKQVMEDTMDPESTDKTKRSGVFRPGTVWWWWRESVGH